MSGKYKKVYTFGESSKLSMREIRLIYWVSINDMCTLENDSREKINAYGFMLRVKAMSVKSRLKC